jgi:hypothetical protein
MRRVKWLWTALFLCSILSFPAPASACPNCKEAVAAQPGEAARLKNGYYYSIIFMVSMPFLLLGTGTLLVVRAVKRGALPPL